MIPKFPEFKKLEFSDKPDVDNIVRKYPPYSDFNYTSMFCWNIGGKMEISELNSNLVVKFTDYVTSEQFYSFLGNNVVNDSARKILLHALYEDVNPILKLIPATSVEGLDERVFDIQEDRENFDYLYNVNFLAAYHGRPYETKRNLVNRLMKFHPQVESKEIDIADKATQEKIIQLIDVWEKNKLNDDKLVDKEREIVALKNLFSVAEDLELISIGVYDSEELIGFSINEPLLGGYAITHFAKSDANYPGIYAFLMRESCRKILWYDKGILNYEQDLGIPSLRFSKESFRPVSFLKKYTVRLK